MKLWKLVLGVIAFVLSTSTNAAVIYQFDFTNLTYEDGSSTGADFSVTLEYSDYVITTGMEALSGAPLLTTIGYSVAYAGTNITGWWGFDDNSYSTIDDEGFAFSGESFLFDPDTRPSLYFTRPGTYTGNISGNAPYSFHGDALLTITEINAVPIPAAVWLFGSGLIGLVGFARRKKAQN